MPYKCTESKYYPTLEKFLGKEITVKGWDGKTSTLPLSIWTSKKGKEGWLTGTFPEGSYVLFADDLIEKVEVTLFNECIVTLM